MERVLLDTNILCGAILGNGVNRKLLQLARTQTAFKPVISEVVIVEFLAKCRSGLSKKKIIIPEDVIDRFFYVLAPILDHENIKRVAIGREIYVDYLTYYKASIQEFFYDMFIKKKGWVRPELLAAITETGKKIENTDPGDIHVMFAAVEHNCVSVLTTTSAFPFSVFRSSITSTFRLSAYCLVCLRLKKCVTPLPPRLITGGWSTLSDGIPTHYILRPGTSALSGTNTLLVC